MNETDTDVKRLKYFLNYAQHYAKRMTSSNFTHHHSGLNHSLEQMEEILDKNSTA